MKTRSNDVGVASKESDDGVVANMMSAQVRPILDLVDDLRWSGSRRAHFPTI